VQLKNDHCKSAVEESGISFTTINMVEDSVLTGFDAVSLGKYN
jgi:hypothetical protein